MPLQEVERRTMWVSVWHSDMFGRNDFLGEVSELSLTPISYFKVKKEVQEIFIIFVHASNINMIHGLKYFCTVLNSRVLCFRWHCQVRLCAVLLTHLSLTPWCCWHRRVLFDTAELNIREILAIFELARTKLAVFAAHSQHFFAMLWLIRRFNWLSKSEGLCFISASCDHAIHYLIWPGKKEISPKDQK